jgi:hypothetical protein
MCVEDGIGDLVLHRGDNVRIFIKDVNELLQLIGYSCNKSRSLHFIYLA